MSDKWYFANQGSQFGPIPSEQILEMFRLGQLNRGSLVWREGMDQWTRLDASELGSSLPSAPPVPPPAPGEDRGGNRFEVNFSGMPREFTLNQNRQIGVGISDTNLNAIGHVATKTNMMAFVALALAIGGFFTGFTFIPSVVCGHLALLQFKRDPSIGGADIAKASLIISYSVIALAALAVIGFFFLMILGAVLNRVD